MNRLQKETDSYTLFLVRQLPNPGFLCELLFGFNFSKQCEFGWKSKQNDLVHNRIRSSGGLIS